MATPTTLRPIATTAPAAIPQPVYKPEEYTIVGIFLKFLEEKIKDVAKALGYTVYWIGQAIPDLPPQAQNFSSLMGTIKNGVSVTEAPKKAKETWEALEKLWTSRTDSWENIGKAARDVFKKSTTLTNSVVDGIDLSSQFIPIDKTTMSWIKGVNFGVLIGGAGNSAIEQVEKLSKTEEAETHKKTLYWINLARDVSYVAAGVLGFGCFIAGAAVIPWLMVAFLTSGLAWTIGGYFYEKIYDPEHLGKNLDPAEVIKNNILRRNYEQQLAAQRLVTV